MSEGEEFIKDFLESENIGYKMEVLIPNLNQDLKNYRKADFYIPKYKVYIEFFGQWNSEKGKERYREKKKIYNLNSIPCIYLYPENLGIIEYIFHKRLVVELKKYHLKKELLKYRLTEVWKERSDNFIFLIIGISILYYVLPFNNEENKLEIVVGAIISLYQLYLIITTFIQIFKNGLKNRRLYI